MSFFFKKEVLIYLVSNKKGVKMIGLVNFIKDIFMIKQEKSFVGLSSIKPIKTKNKKHIVKSVKKSETRLSDLMRREHKTSREEAAKYSR